jgi:hypothetical protein
MADIAKRTHSYHAEGNALGGILTQPLKQTITSQANVSLPEVGGLVSSNLGSFHHEKVVSCASSYAHVTGSVSTKSGGFATLATSVVEDLNILEIVTADRVISRVTTEHPAEGYTPKVTLVGSNFINLRIAGFPVEVVLNFKLLNPPDKYPDSPWLKNAAFLDTIRQQYRGRAKTPAAKELEERFGWIETDAEIEQRGSVVCSLVERIVGTFPGETSGNVVYIPEVGKFFLGELIVDQASFQLTMIRAELGCPFHGAITASSCVVNGSTYP